jgi:hypothetical protein
MRLTYLPGAREDLREIKAYYRSVAPASVAKIRADIRASLDLVALYPFSAPEVPGDSFVAGLGTGINSRSCTRYEPVRSP